jgi:hypothetical protein
MNINIFLVCYNESALLPHAINHYRKYLPSAKITIYDNESTDKSVEIAKTLGCEVVSWNTNNITNEYLLKDLKNSCWKNIQEGWIIMADMDEFLCVNEDELNNEMKNGISILTIKGINIIGESQKIDLSDIDLQLVTRYVDYNLESKSLCFLREKIDNMNYHIGAHLCNPIGKIQYSSKLYLNKHMHFLGLPFLINKYKQGHERCKLMRKHGMDIHYTDDIDIITNNYNNLKSKSNILV